MTESNKKLCLDLMHAETEEEIVTLLGPLWSEEDAWRNLGDIENNYGTVGNQQANPVAALVEKVVNSIDARLMGECLARGVMPSSPQAPQSWREAVATLFEDWHDFDENRPDDGLIVDWTGSHMSEQARQITVTATGVRPIANDPDTTPSISIADGGEGQAPDEFPETLMSLNRSNKLRIPFVQGRFNMGGAGAFRFCGTEHKLQLVVSRRRPGLIASGHSERAGEWGFTVVREAMPTGAMRNPVYQYLAPVSGEVLSFPSETLPIHPLAGRSAGSRPQAFAAESQWGTLIKLYNYQFGGDRSAIFGATGLARRIEVMLPRATLPFLFVDCRYDRHSGMAGFGVETRLLREQDRVLDEQVSGELAIAGARLPVTAYVFKPGQSRSYRPSAEHAVIFQIDGQTHASLHSRFFSRKSVRRNYLSKDLFVVVDCGKLDPTTRFKLFLNSRDRMSEGPLRQTLEESLETFLRESQPLSLLNQQRREIALKSNVVDQSVTREIVANLLRSNPTLQEVLADGLGVLTVPEFEVPPRYEGKQFPTFFEIHRIGKAQGTPATAVAPGSRVLLRFRTDAVNDYFDRITSPGKIDATARDLATGECREVLYGRHGPNAGEVTIWFNELSEGLRPGDAIALRVEVSDDDRINPFSVEIRVDIKDEPSPPGPGKPKKRRTQRDLPKVVQVWKGDWSSYQESLDLEFDKHTAVEMMSNEAQEEGTSPYDIYLNMNNVCLDFARRSSEPNPVLDGRWAAVMTLATMFMVSDSEKRNSCPTSITEEQDIQVETLVRNATRGIAPMVLHLGAVFEEDEPDGS